MLGLCYAMCYAIIVAVCHRGTLFEALVDQYDFHGKAFFADMCRACTRLAQRRGPSAAGTAASATGGPRAPCRATRRPPDTRAGAHVPLSSAAGRPPHRAARHGERLVAATRSRGDGSGGRAGRGEELMRRIRLVVARVRRRAWAVGEALHGEEVGRVGAARPGMCTARYWSSASRLSQRA